MSLHSQTQTQNQPPAPARSQSEEMLDRWNDIGNKLVAMAKDFPEDKYDFKVQKDQRTFALNLLHAAALDFVLIRRISGSNVGPDFGEGDNPTRDQFKTKADVVKFVQEAVADGAQVIQQQGDAGLDKTTKFFGSRWPTTPPSGRSPSSTAASTMASLWSTIVQTTWCRRTRGANAHIRSQPFRYALNPRKHVLLWANHSQDFASRNPFSIEVDLPTMIRHLPFVCVLAVAPILMHAQAQQPARPPAQSSQPPAVANRPQPITPPVPVAPDAPVVTVHGVCPEGQKSPADKPDSCAIVLTRAQFEGLVSSLNVNNTNYPPPALRGFATDYATILALASAGEKAGVEKDPRFADLMKIARARVLAESYRRSLQEKFANPSEDEIAAYYKQNVDKFGQTKIDRIHVPKVDPTRPQDRKPEFETKGQKACRRHSGTRRQRRGRDLSPGGGL